MKSEYTIEDFPIGTKARICRDDDVYYKLGDIITVDSHEVKYNGILSEAKSTKGARYIKGGYYIPLPYIEPYRASLEEVLGEMQI